MFRRRRRVVEAEGGPIQTITPGGRVAATVSGFGATLLRLVHLVALGVVLLIGLAIVLVALDASTHSWVAWHLEDWGHWLAQPFVGMFHVHSHKGSVAINYGVAIIVYLIIAELLSVAIRALFAPARRRVGRPVLH
jgi:hypothetical protein